MATKKNKKPLAPLAYRKIVKFIMEYESNTFSASAQALRRDQAEKMTDRLISASTDRVDGITLQALLEDVRARR